MSLFQIVLLLALTTVTLGALRSARGTFVEAMNERERLTRIVAGLVVPELDGAEAELTITSHGGDLSDVEVFAYATAEPQPEPTTAQRRALPRDELWTVTGPLSEAGDIRWIVWWTCPSGYRWRLTVHNRRRDLRCVARPPGSAPCGTGALADWRNTAWPYTYASPKPRRACNRTNPPTPHTEVAEDDDSVLETAIGDWWESVAQPEDTDATR